MCLKRKVDADLEGGEDDCSFVDMIEDLATLD